MINLNYYHSLSPTFTLPIIFIHFFHDILVVIRSVNYWFEGLCNCRVNKFLNSFCCTFTAVKLRLVIYDFRVTCCNIIEFFVGIHLCLKECLFYNQWVIVVNKPFGITCFIVNDVFIDCLYSVCYVDLFDIKHRLFIKFECI